MTSIASALVTLPFHIIVPDFDKPNRGCNCCTLWTQNVTIIMKCLMVTIIQERHVAEDSESWEIVWEDS